MRLMRSTIDENMKALGPEMTTLFAFYEIAFGPSKRVSMENDEKFALYACAQRSRNTTTESYSINSSTSVRIVILETLHY